MKAVERSRETWRWSPAGVALLLGHLLQAPLLQAQVFSASGGVSTISNAQGGQLTLTGPAYSFSIGGGESNRHLAGGFRYVTETAKAKYIVGNQYARFDLATDVFDPGHFVNMLGAGIETKLEATSVLAFAGATSIDMSSPLFAAARADHPAAALFLRSNLGPSLKATSYGLISEKLTGIEGLQWRPMEHLALAVSGGLGAGHPYAAASLDLNTTRFDVKGAYIYADSEFERYVGRSPALAEPDRGNITISWRPSDRLTLTGGHQNFLSSPSSSTPGLRTSLDDLSIGVTILGTDLTATSFHSSYMATSTYAVACSASRNFGRRLLVEESYLEAWPSTGTPTTTLLTNIKETLTPRWTLSQLVTQSAGQNTVAFGGSFLSNLASISVDYQNYYVPSRVLDPFQRAVIADVQLHAFGRLTLHGSTFVDPQGHLKYTADAVCLLDRQRNQDAVAPRILIGESMIRGRVIDQDGLPVPGAALQFDNFLVYTDSVGRFFLRERRPRLHKLVVRTDRFLNEGSYAAVDAPSSLGSGSADRDETLIVLHRGP